MRMPAGPGIFPQDFSVRSVVGRDSAGVEDENLRNGCQGDQARRTIALAIIAAAPNKLSGRGPVGHQRTIISAARADHYQVTQDEGGAAHTPFVNVALIVLNDVLGPNEFAGCAVEAI